jgi:VIT1/CCC1 family predicted Fe2+/Mn2+ transporter
MSGVLQGRAFGSASTLVAQMGILLGMLVSNQTQSALIVASASSAISGSFGDAFSIYISETTGKRDDPLVAASSVLITKLIIGAVYVSIFMLFGNSNYTVVIATLLTLFLLYYLSIVASPTDVNKTFIQFVTLTLVVVAITSSFGYAVRRSF